MGVNVYLMCRQFHAAEAVIANAMIITTVVSSFTVPLAVALTRYFGGLGREYRVDEDSLRLSRKAC